MLGARKAAAGICRTAPGPAFAWCARPASAAAIPRRRPRSATTSSITPASASVLAAAKAGDTHAHLPDYVDYDAYVAGGGYALLKRLRSGELSEGRSAEGARRRLACAGSAAPAFPTGRKWRAVLGEPGPRLMAINGDEGEPGTFKDRYYLETDPHRFLEGMLIGAHVVEAHGRLHLHPRRISGLARNPRRARSRSCRRAARCCICAAAPAPISAARNPRCWKASRASAACRGTSRLIRSRSACSACRR